MDNHSPLIEYKDKLKARLDYLHEVYKQIPSDASETVVTVELDIGELRNLIDFVGKKYKMFCDAISKDKETKRS